MKKTIYGICTAALLAFGACTNEELPTPGTTDPEGSEEVKPVSGEVLVKFKSYVSDILDQTVVKTRSGAPATRSGILSVDEVLDLVGGYEIERVFPVDERTEERTREAGLNLWYVVRFNEDYTVEQVIERLAPLGEVQYATPNRQIKRSYDPTRKAMPLTRETLEAIKRQTRATQGEYPFNDELMVKQWNLINRGDLFTGTEACEVSRSVVGADVQCEEAWKLSTGDPSIIVAVLDEGVCQTHPELRDNIWTNEDEIDGSKKDNDGNGYAGDIHGFNFVTNTGIITWDDLNDTGHGTHVAGVIAAQNDNGGIGSIAGGTPDKPGVKIMSCQIFAGNAGGNSMSSVKAIKYAADNGAVILQCSWGYTSGTANSYEWGTPGYADEEQWETLAPLEKDALDYFTHNAGSPNGPIDGGIAVFASGNEYANSAGFPGAASMCVSVAATAADFTPATYTNYGPGTNISAPGGDRDYYWDYGEGALRGEAGCVFSTLPTRQRNRLRIHGGNVDGLPARFGCRRAGSLLCGTAAPPLHGRRVQETALRNGNPDRRVHSGHEVLLPLRLRPGLHQPDADDAVELYGPNGRRPGQCQAAARCHRTERHADAVPEPLHPARRRGDDPSGNLLPQRRVAHLHRDHREPGGRHEPHGGCEDHLLGTQGGLDEGLDRSQRRYDPQLQHHGPQVGKRQRLVVTE